MKKIIFTLLVLLAPVQVWASGGCGQLPHCDAVDIDLSNQASLQNGARLFVNYCLSCHSASFMRYNRLGADLGIDDDKLLDNLMFVADFRKDPMGAPAKVGNLMTVAMRPEDAKGWFGTEPPDLSVIARSRGADWLYTYLRTFYPDAKRPFGVNNGAFKDVAMPHVLWELQGVTEPVFEQVMEDGKPKVDDNGKPVMHLVEVKVVKPGTMSTAEYDNAMRDLVAYLVYMGEPAKLKRYSVGMWVLGYLVILFFFAYALKKEYWKDIH